MSNDDSAPLPHDTYPIPMQPEQNPERPWYGRWWMIVIYCVFGTILFFCMVGAISGAGDDESEDPATPSPSAQTETADAETTTTEAAESATPTDEPTTRQPETEPELSETPEREEKPEEPKPEPTTRAAPEPEKPTEEPTTKAPPVDDDSESSVYYKNCDAARAAGAAPVYRDDPGYAKHLDRDGDGVGCEN